MITLELARQLRDAGLVWKAANGDRFVVPDRDMDDQVFVVSDMTIEVHDYPTGRLIGFNGTTEWALDSMDEHAALWLPSEGQLREALGEAFLRLESVTGGYALVFTTEGRESGAERREVDIDAERAYARALLTTLTT